MRTSLPPAVQVTRPGGESETVEPGQLLDQAIARSLGFGAEHRRILAIRDEHLALMEWACRSDSEAPDRCFAVVELDELARLSGIRLFEWDVDSLTEATDYLEARWKATCDPDDNDLLMSEAIRGWRHGDQDLLQQILHDDFQVVDHRSFSWGDYTKETFIALFDPEARNVVVEIPAVYLGRSGSGRAFQLTAWGCGEDEMIEALHGHFIGIVRDDKVLCCHGHDIDTPHETMARLRELQIELGDIAMEPADAPNEDPWIDADFERLHGQHAASPPPGSTS